MPADVQDSGTEPRASIRAAVLELAASGAIEDKAELIAALRRIVEGGRSRAADLWEAYRGGRPDARARFFARYAD